VCSNLTPPTSFGILYQDPNEVGQSGTEVQRRYGDQSAGNDQKKCPAGEDNGEPMVPAIVSCRMAFRVAPLGNLGSREGGAGRTATANLLFRPDML